MAHSINSNNIAKAGPIGRSARVGLGIVFLWLCVRFISGYAGIVQPGNLALYLWAAVGVYSHSLGTVIPFLRKSRRRLAVLSLLLVGAVGLDLLLYGRWWGAPLAVLLYVLAIAALGILGMEFVLAGIKGYAGCESTAIPNLLRPDSEPKIVPCPLWDPIDRWERRRFSDRSAGKF